MDGNARVPSELANSKADLLRGPVMAGKPIVRMSNAKVTQSYQLKGEVEGHPKLDDGWVRTSSIVGMTFDEDGSTRVETRNTVYVVELKGRREVPDNHPSNDSSWWNQEN